MMVANPPKTERNAEIYALYMEDQRTLASIARDFNISAGRVKQIITKQDYLAQKEALERAAT